MGRFHQATLSNGLRVVTETMPDVPSVALGFMARTGSRDETAPLAGVSHFLEHMCFKGTPKRGWQQINVDFDEMGSTYNAFTSKEKTFYFGWVRKADLERQAELLADMMRSVLPEGEFTTEKKVILEEIAMSDDQIDRHLYDLLHERLFPAHPLGWPVLGHKQTIESLSRDQMKTYFDQRYNPGNLVLLVAGAVEPEDSLRVAEKFCGYWPGRGARDPRIAPQIPARGVATLQLERFKQQAVAMAFPAPSAADPDDETSEFVAAILGGQNSRFFWHIVQEGIAPVAAAHRIDYCDAGIMLTYAFGEPPNIERATEAMRREIARLASEGATAEEVQRVKNRRRTALASEAEAPYHRLMQLAHDVDIFGRPRSVEERLAAVDAVTAGSIRDYFKRWPMAGDGFLVSVGPRLWPQN